MNPIHSWEKMLDQILKGQEYQVYYQDNRNLLQRLWDWIKEWVLELIYEWFGGLSPSSTAGDIIVAILLFVGLIIVIMLAVYVMRYWRGNQRLKKSQPFGDIDTQSLTLTDYQTSLAKAEQNKNYSLAIRYQFLVLLVKLDQREWILKKSWKTNWDYYQELKQDRERNAELFYQLAVYFDSVTYGNRHVNAEDYQTYVKKIQRYELEE